MNSTKKTGAFVMGLALASLASSILMAPKAHAISAEYRRQLEREHKTQVQDAHTYAHPVKAPHFKAIHVHKYGIDFKRDPDGIGYMDGSACAVEEQNQYATVYSCGLHLITARTNGRVDLMKEGQFVGHMN